MLGLPAVVVAKEPARVAAARQKHEASWRAKLSALGLAYPPAQLFLRAFKHEGELEVWAGPAGGVLQEVARYPICARSGTLGPKRREGDGQVPEGFYRVTVFNPYSDYHLSFGLDYPNASDRVLSDRRRPGSAIFIHGDCVTIGCLPLAEQIEPLYVLAQDVHTAGRTIPVHVFPTRLDEAGLARLTSTAGDDAALLAFWRGLVPGYEAFERTRRPPRIAVDPKTGAYRATAVETAAKSR